MRILFVKLSSIGDIVHTLPALAATAAALPDARISWVAEARSAEILRDNPLIENLIEVNTRAFRGGKTIDDMALDGVRQLGELRRFKFDVAIDFQGLWKSAAIAGMSRSARTFGFSKTSLREPSSRFLLGRLIDVPPQINVIRKNLALVRGALGIEVPDGDFSFPIATSDEHRAEADAIAEKCGGPFAILNPAGGWVTKLWPAENFGALADRLWEEFGLASVVATGPNETELAERALSTCKSGRAIHSTPSLKGFYELARQSRIYIGGDTGPTHLAVAAKAPMVGIFGPTEWWRNGSPDPRDICVERNDIGCRVDCHRRTCDKWICMDIPVETVVHAVRARLG